MRGGIAEEIEMDIDDIGKAMSHMMGKGKSRVPIAVMSKGEEKGTGIGRATGADTVTDRGTGMGTGTGTNTNTALIARIKREKRWVMTWKKVRLAFRAGPLHPLPRLRQILQRRLLLSANFTLQMRLM